MRYRPELVAVVAVVILVGCAGPGAPDDVVERDAPTTDGGPEGDDPDDGSGEDEADHVDGSEGDSGDAADGSSSPARPAPPSEDCEGELREAIVSPVTVQLEAFAAGAADTAYAQASEDVRGGIDVETFTELVRQAYPEVFDPEDWTFGPCSTDGDGQAVLAVDVTGSSGETVGYTYLLVREPDGWAVAAVTANTPPDQDPAEA